MHQAPWTSNSYYFINGFHALQLGRIRWLDLITGPRIAKTRLHRTKELCPEEDQK